MSYAGWIEVDGDVKSAIRHFSLELDLKVVSMCHTLCKGPPIVDFMI